MTFIFDTDPTYLIAALRTITPDHRCFKRISFDTTHPFRLLDRDRINFSALREPAIREITHTVWLEFDSLLVQLWESHGSRVGALCDSLLVRRVRDYAKLLLPEATKRGIVDITESAGELFSLTPRYPQHQQIVESPI